MQKQDKKSSLDSSDTLIEGQWKNPMVLDNPLHHNKAEQALQSATLESEKPMEIHHNEYKKCACIPTNVSIKENAPNKGSPETSTPEQK